MREGGGGEGGREGGGRAKRVGTGVVWLLDCVLGPRGPARTRHKGVGRGHKYQGGRPGSRRETAPVK